MTESTKASPETFRLLVRYTDLAPTKIDLHVLGKAMGTNYKSAWDGMNKARKDLVAAGYKVPTAAAAKGEAKEVEAGATAEGSGGGGSTSAKKRKVEVEDEVAMTTKRGRGRPAKKKRGGNKIAAAKDEAPAEADGAAECDEVVEEDNDIEDSSGTAAPKRGRGGPPKKTRGGVKTAAVEADETAKGDEVAGGDEVAEPDEATSGTAVAAPKRGRGRPPKEKKTEDKIAAAESDRATGVDGLSQGDELVYGDGLPQANESAKTHESAVVKVAVDHNYPGNRRRSKAPPPPNRRVAKEVSAAENDGAAEGEAIAQSHRTAEGDEVANGGTAGDKVKMEDQEAEIADAGANRD